VKRNILPYNPKLKEFAKKLRSNMTYSEVKLWNELKNGKLNGYDFAGKEQLEIALLIFIVRMFDWQ
jgi:very-short-patch-repair endonuclease